MTLQTRTRARSSQLSVGFIGQGWIGRNYADEFEERGFAVTRYALEAPYDKNKDLIAACDVVFIAVPTPTTKKGFDDSYVRAVLPLVGKGKIAVIKSTLLPGTTEALQKAFPKIVVLHSPEFLREAQAAYDVRHPSRNIVGIPKNTPAYKEYAARVLSILPQAPVTRTVPAATAELVKYAGNNFLFMKVVFANLLFDLSEALHISYADVAELLGADPRIGPSHLSVKHASGHAKKAGRGAGGHCFIKDFEAFVQLYATLLPDDADGTAMLRAIRRKNISLLTDSGKDIDLLRGIYGANR